MEPFSSLLLFVPTVLLGALVRKKAARLAIVAICVGCAGIALVASLDQTNRLVQHSRWGKRGMP